MQHRPVALQQRQQQQQSPRRCLYQVEHQQPSQQQQQHKRQTDAGSATAKVVSQQGVAAALAVGSSSEVCMALSCSVRQPVYRPCCCYFFLFFMLLLLPLVSPFSAAAVLDASAPFRGIHAVMQLEKETVERGPPCRYSVAAAGGLLSPQQMKGAREFEAAVCCRPATQRSPLAGYFLHARCCSSSSSFLCYCSISSHTKSCNNSSGCVRSCERHNSSRSKRGGKKLSSSSTSGSGVNNRSSSNGTRGGSGCRNSHNNIISNGYKYARRPCTACIAAGFFAPVNYCRSRNRPRRWTAPQRVALPLSSRGRSCSGRGRWSLNSETLPQVAGLRPSRCSSLSHSTCKAHIRSSTAKPHRSKAPRLDASSGCSNVLLPLFSCSGGSSCSALPSAAAQQRTAGCTRLALLEKQRPPVHETEQQKQQEAASLKRRGTGEKSKQDGRPNLSQLAHAVEPQELRTLPLQTAAGAAVEATGPSVAPAAAVAQEAVAAGSARSNKEEEGRDTMAAAADAWESWEEEGVLAEQKQPPVYYEHTPVLLEEVTQLLLTQLDGLYIDCTAGGGGHAAAIWNRIAPHGGRLLAIDVDAEAVAACRRRLRQMMSTTTAAAFPMLPQQQQQHQEDLHSVAVDPEAATALRQQQQEEEGKGETAALTGTRGTSRLLSQRQEHSNNTGTRGGAAAAPQEGEDEEQKQRHQRIKSSAGGPTPAAPRMAVEKHCYYHPKSNKAAPRAAAAATQLSENSKHRPRRVHAGAAASAAAGASRARQQRKTGYAASGEASQEGTHFFPATATASAAASWNPSTAAVDAPPVTSELSPVPSFPVGRVLPKAEQSRTRGFGAVASFFSPVAATDKFLPAASAASSPPAAAAGVPPPFAPADGISPPLTAAAESPQSPYVSKCPAAAATASSSSLTSERVGICMHSFAELPWALLRMSHLLLPTAACSTLTNTKYAVANESEHQQRMQAMEQQQAVKKHPQQQTAAGDHRLARRQEATEAQQRQQVAGVAEAFCPARNTNEEERNVVRADPATLARPQHVRQQHEQQQVHVEEGSTIAAAAAARKEAVAASTGKQLPQTCSADRFLPKRREKTEELQQPAVPPCQQQNKNWHHALFRGAKETERSRDEDRTQLQDELVTRVAAAAAVAARTRLQRHEQQPQQEQHLHQEQELQQDLFERVRGTADGILADLGVSTHQLTAAYRGFSYTVDGPLDMRYAAAEATEEELLELPDLRHVNSSRIGSSANGSKSSSRTSAAEYLRTHEVAAFGPRSRCCAGGLNAARLVNQLPESMLSRILREYGEEPLAARIAAAINRHRAPVVAAASSNRGREGGTGSTAGTTAAAVAAREAAALGMSEFGSTAARRGIFTTHHLREIVESCCSYRNPKYLRKTCARVFQALRIYVNNELRAIDRLLLHAALLLKPGGRLAIISYHSLEDRLVKHRIATAVAPPPARLQEKQQQGRGGKSEEGEGGNEVMQAWWTDLFGLQHAHAEQCHGGRRIWRALHKKPIRPTAEAILRNPRARSAKLRVAERLPS